MAVSNVSRGGGSYPIALVADGTGTIVQFSACSGAILLVEDGSGTLELCVVAKPGDAPAPLINAEAQPCTLAVDAGSAYEFPTAVYAATYVVLRGVDGQGVLFVKG
jgi:hypothetical protein